MKEILILRLGKHHPLPKEIPLIRAICGPNLAFAQGLPIPGIGVITLLMSDWSLQEIAQAYRKLAEETDDQLPVVVLDLAEGGHSLDDFPNFEEALRSMREEAKEKPKTRSKPKKEVTRCELSLDELLDVVSSKGVRGLSKQQRERLKELSKK